jgi:hypothetical protein
MMVQTTRSVQPVSALVVKQYTYAQVYRNMLFPYQRSHTFCYGYCTQNLVFVRPIRAPTFTMLLRSSFVALSFPLHVFLRRRGWNLRSVVWKPFHLELIFSYQPPLCSVPYRRVIITGEQVLFRTFETNGGFKIGFTTIPSHVEGRT